MAALLAFVIAAALAGYPLLRSGSLVVLILALGLLGLALLLLALAGAVRLLPWSIALIAFEYVLVLLLRGEPLVVAPFYGAGLLVVGEAGYGSLELRRGREEESVRRLAWLAVVALAAFAVAVLPVIATRIKGPVGIAAEVAGIAFVLGLAGVAPYLANRNNSVKPDEGSALRSSTIK
jgi:hypothetical protein